MKSCLRETVCMALLRSQPTSLPAVSPPHTGWSPLPCFGSPHKENRVHCNSGSLLDEGQKTWLCKQEPQVLRISLGAALILDVVILWKKYCWEAGKSCLSTDQAVAQPPWPRGAPVLSCWVHLRIYPASCSGNADTTISFVFLKMIFQEHFINVELYWLCLLTFIISNIWKWKFHSVVSDSLWRHGL